jgi:hypothetical protein
MGTVESVFDRVGESSQCPIKLAIHELQLVYGVEKEQIPDSQGEVVGAGDDATVGQQCHGENWAQVAFEETSRSLKEARKGR